MIWAIVIVSSKLNISEEALSLLNRGERYSVQYNMKSDSSESDKDSIKSNRVVICLMIPISLAAFSRKVSDL